MNSMDTARTRLERAAGLPAILDAAYRAFDDMLPVIRDHEDPAGGAFTAFVMASALAANGRDAVAYAPSLPPAAAGSRKHEHAGSATALDAAIALAQVGRVLISRLTEAAVLAADAVDRSACAEGARQASRLVELLAEAAGQ